MIEVFKKDYTEGDLAIRTIEVTFFCMPIYKYIKTSTNNKAIAQLSKANKPKIKGFK